MVQRRHAELGGEIEQHLLRPSGPSDALTISSEGATVRLGLTLARPRSPLHTRARPRAHEEQCGVPGDQPPETGVLTKGRREHNTTYC